MGLVEDTAVDSGAEHRQLQRSTPAQQPRRLHESCGKERGRGDDCEGGRGDGPLFTGRVIVVGPDVFRLDGDGDGIGCR